MSDLPDGWEWATLGDIADSTLGKMLDRGKDGGGKHVPYLRNENVQWGSVDLSSLLTMEMSPDEHDHYSLREGDLLVCEGGEIGRSAVWNSPISDISFQKAVHRVRPYCDVNSKYIMYFLMELSQSGKILHYATGSTIKHLPQKKLRSIAIPMPPSAEQRRIVAALEECGTQLEDGKTALAGSATKNSLLLKSIIEKTAGQYKSQSVKFSDLIVGGLSNGRSVNERASGTPVLRLTALSGDRVDLTQTKNGDWDADSARPYLLSEGDFLIARGNGSLDLVGRGALLEDTPNQVAFPDTIVRARPDSNLIDGKYLSIIWNSQTVRQQIRSMARTTAGIYKINQKGLSQLQLPLPSLSDQRSIVDRILGAKEKMEKLQSSLEGVQTRAQQLRRSLLRKAFAGQLVPQDPHDEPASLLLERIRAERAQSSTGKRTSRAKKSAKTVSQAAASTRPAEEGSSASTAAAEFDVSKPLPESPGRGTQDTLELDL